MATGTYDLISSYTIRDNSGASQVDITGFPSTYRTLMLVMRYGGTIANNDLFVRFNNNATNVYGWASQSAAPGVNTTRGSFLNLTGNASSVSNVTNLTNTMMLKIISYADTNEYPLILSQGQTSYTTNFFFTQGYFNNSLNTQITSINIYLYSGNLRQNSTFDLYGLAGI